MNDISYKIIMLHLKKRIIELNDSRSDDRIATAQSIELKRVIHIIDAEVKSVKKNGPRVERDLEIMKELYEEMLQR